MLYHSTTLLYAIWALVAIVVTTAAAAAPEITIKNQCSYNIWIGQTPNAQFKPLSGAGLGAADILKMGDMATYTIPNEGWGGRFYAKTGCDANGNNCASGSSVAPCPANGCEPPAETKVEFFYHPLSDTQNPPYYDISLVDGYNIPMKITPSQTGGSCVETTCSVSIDDCPQTEIDGIGDLRASVNGQNTMCLSPCMKWTYPAPYGDGKSKTVQPGLDMCCPNPPVTSDQCRNGDVVKTEYVKLVRSNCPSAYSYSFDDVAGLHDCPSGTSFAVVVCP